MWKRISGKSSDTKDNPAPRPSRRNEEAVRSKPSSSSSTVSRSPNKQPSAQADDHSSTFSKKSSLRGDDRDRGFNPTSTSFSSTSQSPYPGTASASVATAPGNHNDEPYIPPGLVRNASLANQMPKSRSSRDGRVKDEEEGQRSERRVDNNYDEEGLPRGDQAREKREKRVKKEKNHVEGSSTSIKSSRYESVYGNSEAVGTSRGHDGPPDQVGASGVSQLPGQYSGGMPTTNRDPSGHPVMSSHVQDQFPGQFPDQSTAPYRPPVDAGQEGVGLAAEYYGDAGESVAQQPGIRANTPSLIVGAEPHLQAALAEAAPPPEPSASGGVGAAASFFSGDFDDQGSATSQDHQTSPTFSTAPLRPQGNHHASSAPAIPTIGGAAIGAAAGYLAGSQTTSHAQRPDHASSVGGPQQDYGSSLYHRPPPPTAESYYSHTSRPQRPDKHSSQPSNIPPYAVGAAAAAGLASASYSHGHQSSSQHSSLRPQGLTNPMAQRHRYHGGLGAVVDFFKDPDGVAKFEEYSEVIGVCKYCFAPGSSPRDAPRKHHYRRGRSNENLGRVDKESRYHSSENEGRRRKDKSWLASGLAGYGLAKVGESLFKQKNDFEDTYSVKTGRYSPDGSNQKSRSPRRSEDRIGTGITSDGRVLKRDPHDGLFGSPKSSTYEVPHRLRTRSRSWSKKQTNDPADAAIEGRIRSSTSMSGSRRRKSSSPKTAPVKDRRKHGEHSPERRRKSNKKKGRGFFSMSSATSSSSSVNNVHGSDRHRSSKRSTTKSKDDKKAEAAILGLGAAAAAFALNDGRNGHKKKGVKELVGVKETREGHDRNFRHQPHSEDEVWESASEEDDESADSALAYGGPRRKGSQESLTSESSGTNKWGWRWGNKKVPRRSPAKREPSDHGRFSTIEGVASAGAAGTSVTSSSQYGRNDTDVDNRLPLQQVFPIPTSDPNRFDVGRETSITSSSRPAVTPIQHPQPIAPVSAALYSGRPPYEHSYSAPTGPRLFSQDNRRIQPLTTADAPVARNTPHAKQSEYSLMLRRRDSSPARLQDDAMSSSLTSSRHTSAKDNASTVRFDRSEEQEEADRRERRRKRREDRKRREAEEEDQRGEERSESKVKLDREYQTLEKQEESPKISSETSWAVPAAIGVVGAAIGAASLAEKSKPEETREERRERRRREREREEAEDREANMKRERRRKERKSEREHVIHESVSIGPPDISFTISHTRGEADSQRRGKPRSIWQEAARPKNTVNHEDYGAFFKPLDLDDANHQVKVTGANANADIDIDRKPAIVMVAPKGSRDLDAQPTFSPLDTDEVVDASRAPFPIPRLQLVEPTPPSSRNSTPIIKPQETADEDIEEEARKAPSPPKVTWGDDQTHEYVVISPDDDADHGGFIGSAPDELGDADPAKVSEPLMKSAGPRNIAQGKGSPTITESKDALMSFGDDVGFAAALAASAEDAGFDPSIVIDDPMYRRRDSPPGSNNCSMPGSFDDDEIPVVSKRSKKKKSREGEIQDEHEEPSSRDDTAIVQEIVSQVESFDPHDPKKDPVVDLKDWESGKKSKSRKAKKARKENLESKQDFIGSPESVISPHESGTRGTYQSPREDKPPIPSSAPHSNGGGSSKKSRKKAKHDSTGFDDTASTVSSQSTATASSESGSRSKKGSVWDRVLGRSSKENGDNNLADEANTDGFDEPKKKGKKVKGQKSARDGSDDDEIASKPSATAEPDNDRLRNGVGVSQEPGRTTPGLPAKVHPSASVGRTPRCNMLKGNKDPDPSRRNGPDAGSVSEISEVYNEPTIRDGQRSESFLEMRPEPPPPPDRVLKDKPPDPCTIASLPQSPYSPSEDRTRHYTHVHPSEPLASPTAIPFDFRFSRPRPSIRSARSMSQTPPSSPHFAADLPPRTKPRPRSTEFKSSDEFRPLMLVERHRSHHESTLAEAYPSLPSSHTTSQSSSVQDPEEDEHGQRGHYEMTEPSHDILEAGHPRAIDTGGSTMQPDLLDSQQTTPTASSFQHSAIRHDTLPISGNRVSPSQVSFNQQSPEMSFSTREAALAAVIRGSTALALHKSTETEDSSMPTLPQDEHDQLQQSLDSMAVIQEADRSGGERYAHPASLVARQGINTLDEGSPQDGGNQLRQPFDDIAPDVECSQMLDSGVVSKAYILSKDDVNLESGKGMLETEKDFPSQRQDDTFPDVEASSAALPLEDFDPTEDSAPNRTVKGKRSKREQSRQDPPEDQTTVPALRPGASSRDTVASLDTDTMRQIQEQDAQDAVDSWFAPASLSIKETKKRRKETLDDLPETIQPSVSIANSGNLRSPELFSHQPDEFLAQKDSFDHAVGDLASSTRDVDDVVQQISQPTITPSRDAMASLLERRHSKSKSKKGKKARKSASQIPTSPPDSPDTKDVGLTERFSEQLSQSESHPPKPTVETEDPENWAERRIASGVEPCPEAVPLPFGDALDLLDEQPQETEDPEQWAERRIASGIELPPEAIPLPFEEDLDLLDEQPQKTEDHEKWAEPQVASGIELLPEAIPLPSEEDLDLLDEQPQPSYVLTMSQLENMETEAPPSIRHDVSPRTKKLDSHTSWAPREASDEQDQVEADESSATPPRRKVKKGKLAGSSILEEVASNADVEDKAVLLEGPLDTATQQKQGQDSAREPSHGEPEGIRVAEDERAGFATKKKEKKRGKAKQSVASNIPMPPEVSLDAATQNHSQEAAKELVGESPGKPVVAEDEWGGVNVKKKGKKSKRAKQGSTEDGKASGVIKSTTPMVTLTTQDAVGDVTTDPVKVCDTLGESRMVEDEWANSDFNKKTEKNQKGKPSVKDDAEIGVGVETGTLSFVDLPVAADNRQTQSFADVSGAHTLEQEPTASEERRSFGFVNTNKGKESENIRQDFASGNEKSAGLSTDTGLAGVTPKLTEDLLAENLTWQDNVSTLDEEPEAFDKGGTNLSGKYGKKATAYVSPNALEDSQINAKSPEMVIVSEVVDNAQAKDAPFPDTVTTSQQEPQTVEDEGVGSASRRKVKKDKKRKPKREGIDPEPELMPELAENNGVGNMESIPQDATKAITSTSRDITAILEASGNHAPGDKESDEPSLNGHEADYGVDVSTTDRVRHSDKRDLPQEVSVGFNPAEPDGRESKVIDQYVGDEGSPNEDDIRPEARASEEVEHGVINQRLNEEILSPSLTSSVAATDTERALQHMLRDEELPKTPGLEAETAETTSANEELPASHRVREYAEPEWDLPKKNGKKSNNGANTLLHEAKMDDTLQPFTSSAEVEMPSGQSAVVESRQDVPKNKKSKEGSKEALMLDEPQAPDPLQASIVPADIAILLDRGSVPEMVNEFSFKQSKKEDKNKSLSGTLGSQEVAPKVALHASEVHRNSAVPASKGEAEPAGIVSHVDLPGEKDSEPSATIEQIHSSQAEEVAREGEQGCLLDFKSSKDKKDKKKAKKANTLSSMDEGSASPMPEKKPLTGPKDDIGEHTMSFGDEAVDERTDVFRDRPETIEIHKAAEHLQQQSLKSEVTMVSSESVPSQDTRQPIDNAQAGTFGGHDPSDPVKTAVGDDVEPAVNEYPHPDMLEHIEDSLKHMSEALPVPAQDSVALNNFDVRSESSVANIEKAAEHAEYPSSNLKMTKTDRMHVKDVGMPTLEGLEHNEFQQNPETSLEEPIPKMVQLEPFSIPTSNDCTDATRQDKPIEQNKPTEVVEPGVRTFQVREHEDIHRSDAPPAIEVNAGQSVETKEHDFAPLQKSQDDNELRAERYLTSEPETDPLIMGEAPDSVVAYGSGRHEEMAVEEDPRDDVKAAGEKQSTPEAGMLSITADYKPQKLLRGSKTQEVIGTEPEDQAWDVPVKKGKKGKKSKGRGSSFGPETRGLSADRKADSPVNVGSGQDEESISAGRDSQDKKAFDRLSDAPSGTKVDNKKSPTVPKLQDLKFKIEDEPWGMPTKKGRKGKRSKKEKALGYEPETERTSTEVASTPVIATNSGRNNVPLLEEQPQRGLNVDEEIDKFNLVTEKETKESIPTLHTQEITETKAEDEMWGLPAKKEKKGKKRRKDALQVQGTLGVVDAAVSSPSAGAYQSSESDPSRPSLACADVEAASVVNMPPSDPNVELLDSQEQRQDNEESALDLERQGVVNPFNLTAGSLTSRTELDTLDFQGQVEHLHQHIDKPERQHNDALQSPTTNFPTQFEEFERKSPQTSLDEDPEHAKDVDQPNSETFRTSPVELLVPIPGQKQMNQSQEHLEEIEQEPSEASPIPTIDLPTPVAQVKMLDAQEQEDYDKEYAKELERQLSPLQRGEGSSLSARGNLTSSSPQASVDSAIERPFEERIPLARHPPLEDIIEESRSRPGSVPESILNPDVHSASSKATKKTKKAKNGKKQKQSLIWEDDTATPPIEGEYAQGTDVPTGSFAEISSREPGDSNRAVELEAPIEHRPLGDSRVTSPTHVELPKISNDAQDYFSMQPIHHAEEDIDIGGDDEMYAFRRALSTNVPDETLSTHDTYPSIQETEHTKSTLQGLAEAGQGSVVQPFQPETPTGSINEEVDDNLSYKPTKKSRKDRYSKRGETKRKPNPSVEDSEQVVESTRRIGTPPVNSPSQKSAPQDDSTQRSPHREEDPLSSSGEPAATGQNFQDTEALTVAAGAGAAAALVAEGLSGRDSKKSGKKSKKGNKATRWVDLEDKTPVSASSFSREDAVTQNVGQHPVLEQQSGILPEQEGEERDKVAEQGNTVRSWQGSSDNPSQSPLNLADEIPVTEASDGHRADLPADHSGYRDSAINVFDSPVLSEDAPVHQAMRDSGYPETEASPILITDPSYHDTPSERGASDIQERRSEPEYDPGYMTPKRRRSNSPPILSLADNTDNDVSVPEPGERQRRSRSYDSDDSADSGFDIQRRRRRRAMAQDLRGPSPVNSTTKNQSSVPLDSSSARQEVPGRQHEESASTRKDTFRQEPTWSFGHQNSPPAGAQDVSREVSSPETSGPFADQSTYDKLTGNSEGSPASLFGGPIHQDEEIQSESRSHPISETRGRGLRLNTISEDDQEKLPLHANDERSLSDVGMHEAGVQERRARSPSIGGGARSSLAHDFPEISQAQLAADVEQPLDEVKDRRGRHGYSELSNPSHLPSVPSKQGDGEHRTGSAASVQSDNSIHAIILTPDQVRSASGHSYRSSGTPPLRRVDLRGASKLGEAKLRAKLSEAELDSGINIHIPSSSTYDPVTDKGKSRADMADVYEGWGDVRSQSPMSPTRPPSMRKRQSMQRLDLETRLDQLVSENRLLQSQKATAERTLQEQTRDHSQQRQAYEEALEEHKAFLAQKDSELDELRDIVEDWQNKVTHLTEVNEGLIASREAEDDNARRYKELEAEHLHLRERHTELTTGMEALVQREVASHLEAKNSELQRLRDELESAKQQVRNLQQQLLASRENEDFIEKDEDYFDSQCQSLCQHVQQWVLRFSKFSDMKACYRASEIRDETKLDRMENAILDGTDVDIYLQDRVKRRDVFMAVVMTMIFDYIFTRYLFGMDREQRQKLKNLEKTLQEVGPTSAVCKWRATTLTLLMKREDFARQRTTDTEAIVHEIYDTLATFLPPPSHLVTQIQDSLRKVINAAADLSIEMRTQRADYQMLPPLQPVYDTNGDLAQKVYFNALTMNERSGTTTSNQVLQEQGAVVRMVLFPLVVKNEEDDEQIIVCPAQVLTADSKAKKTVRVMSVQGSTQGGRSEASFAGSEGGMF